MAIEDQLRDRLRKAEALHLGAATPGERQAAGAAIERLQLRLKEEARADPPVELKFTLPDSWSVRLFIALCRRYGFKPYRYPRQRRTTLMVKAHQQVFDELVWQPFAQLHEDLTNFLEETTDKVDSSGNPQRYFGGGTRAGAGCAREQTLT